MTAVETRTSRVAFVGRVADELTRADLTPRQFRATIFGYSRRAELKEDGYFVFADIPAAPSNYTIELAGPLFQPRLLSVSAPVTGTLEIAPPGEDELHVIVTNIDASDRVEFAPVSFVPRIAAGSPVLGEGGFSTTLHEPVEGADVDGAELVSTSGAAIDEMLRIGRSSRILLRPGPYYPFPESTTVVAVRVMETAGDVPIAGAQLEITQVNGAAVTSTTVAGVPLFRAALPPAPATPFMLGSESARTTLTNARGDAVFYHAPNTPVTSLTLRASLPGYTTQSVTVAVQAGRRVSATVQLVRT